MITKERERANNIVAKFKEPRGCKRVELAEAIESALADARRAALEEAAEIAVRYEQQANPDGNNLFANGFRHACYKITEAIRQRASEGV